jgi:hypothetical protein
MIGRDGSLAMAADEAAAAAASPALPPARDVMVACLLACLLACCKVHHAVLIVWFKNQSSSPAAELAACLAAMLIFINGVYGLCCCGRSTPQAAADVGAHNSIGC